tara:strand:+ start:2189 stop:2320 length:132 start_codon:yes stop_codon:yes gene_type:complete
MTWVRVASREGVDLIMFVLKRTRMGWHGTDPEIFLFAPEREDV